MVHPLLWQANCYKPTDGKAVCIKDTCGKCNGDGKSCADCAGTPNGGAYKDKCGKCDAKAQTDCKADCTGVWGGNAARDKCKKCVGRDTPAKDIDACLDCKGVAYGRARQPCPRPCSSSLFLVPVLVPGRSQLCTAPGVRGASPCVFTPRPAAGPATKLSSARV